MRGAPPLESARGGGDGRGGGATERTGDVRGAHELEDHGADQLAAARAVVLARPRGETPQPHPRQVDVQERSPRGGRVRALPKCASAAGLSDQPSGVRNAESASSPIPIAPAGARRPSRRRGPREGGYCQVTPNENSRRAVFACAGAGSSPSREKTLTSRTRRVLRQGASEARRSRPPPRHREDDPRARQPQPHHRPRRGAGGRRSAYDAQYADHKGPVAHVGRTASGGRSASPPVRSRTRSRVSSPDVVFASVTRDASTRSSVRAAAHPRVSAREIRICAPARTPGEKSDVQPRPPFSLFAGRRT